VNFKQHLTGQTTRRLLTCMVGAVVIAMMWGPQQGSPDDYGYGFHQAVLRPRIFIFLLLGLLAFIAAPFAPHLKARFKRPGAGLLLWSLAGVGAARSLLHWYDPAGNGKFASASRVATAGLADAYFGWLYILAWVVVAGLGTLAVLTANRAFAVAGIAAAIASAALSIAGHADLVGARTGIDHSYGADATALAYAFAAIGIGYAGWTSAGNGLRSFADDLQVRYPGSFISLVGLFLAVTAIASATWFSPGRLNAGLWSSGPLFDGTGISPVAGAMQRGGLAGLLAAAAIAGGVGLIRSSVALRLIGAFISLAGGALTLYTAHAMGAIGASGAVDGATSAWDNLGTGPWYALIGFLLIAVGLGSLWFDRISARRGQRADRITSATILGKLTVTPTLAAGLIVAIVLPCVFTGYWQQVLVSQVGVYVLLAVGLNVVVGWTGLLDLGFIAFYAIGSYMTAFLVGALPIQPPFGVHLSPLAAIPFAIAACIGAGVALGAPTLRLRGDYLAIVTLGFGEIIRIVAINNPGEITNSTRGPERPVPHPHINLGLVDLKWDSSPLPYWYLLLFILGAVVVFFIRLERSSVGRAWAAVREDEVAARACGVDTTQAKLLAFAIGASTSGLAGVFFASQIGYFNPDNFLLANSILVLAYVVFGGMGSMTGVMIGAAFLTWLPEFLKDQVPADDRQMWIGAVLLLMMIFRPAGLIPERRRRAELEGLDDRPSLETVSIAESEGL
jgi:ABC-type branched-subunit amino acid transport system permease subunit